jgi:hypothetical protein
LSQLGKAPPQRFGNDIVAVGSVEPEPRFAVHEGVDMQELDLTDAAGEHKMEIVGVQAGHQLLQRPG